MLPQIRQQRSLSPLHYDYGLSIPIHERVVAFDYVLVFQVFHDARLIVRLINRIPLGTTKDLHGDLLLVVQTTSHRLLVLLPQIDIRVGSRAEFAIQYRVSRRFCVVWVHSASKIRKSESLASLTQTENGDLVESSVKEQTAQLALFMSATILPLVFPHAMSGCEGCVFTTD